MRYRVTLGNGEVIEVDNPTKWPNPSEISKVEEPMIEATVITREDSLGEILKLLEEKRGDQKKFEHLGGARVMLVYEMPLNEIVQMCIRDRKRTGHYWSGPRAAGRICSPATSAIFLVK